MAKHPIPVNRVIIAFLLLSLVCGAVYCWLAYGPEARYKRAVMRYPVGMPVEEIVKQHPGEVQVERTGNILPFEPGEREKRRYVFYYLRLRRENAVVDLNFYKEVIRVRKLSTIGEPQ